MTSLVETETTRVPSFLASIYANHSIVSTPSILSRATSYSNTNSNSNADTSPSPHAHAQAQNQPPPNALYLPPPALPKLEEDLVPPENFSLVTTGVYRSGFPKKRNFAFMQTLRLKTVLTLVLEDYPQANLEWCQSQDIQFMQFGIPGNKEPFDNIPEDVICSALVAILDVRNHPILIHCNKGKHRTGCLIGCIRRLQSWSLTSIFDEYRRFSSPKSRAVDQQFIDLFDIHPVWEEVDRKGGGLGNLPRWGMLTLPRRKGPLNANSVSSTGASTSTGNGNGTNGTTDGTITVNATARADSKTIDGTRLGNGNGNGSVILSNGLDANHGNQTDGHISPLSTDVVGQTQTQTQTDPAQAPAQPQPQPAQGQRAPLPKDRQGVAKDTHTVLVPNGMVDGDRWETVDGVLHLTAKLADEREGEGETSVS